MAFGHAIGPRPDEPEEPVQPATSTSIDEFERARAALITPPDTEEEAIARWPKVLKFHEEIVEGRRRAQALARLEKNLEQGNFERQNAVPKQNKVVE